MSNTNPTGFEDIDAYLNEYLNDPKTAVFNGRGLAVDTVLAFAAINGDYDRTNLQRCWARSNELVNGCILTAIQNDDKKNLRVHRSLCKNLKEARRFMRGLFGQESVVFSDGYNAFRNNAIAMVRYITRPDCQDRFKHILSVNQEQHADVSQYFEPAQAFVIHAYIRLYTKLIDELDRMLKKPEPKQDFTEEQRQYAQALINSTLLPIIGDFETRLESVVNELKLKYHHPTL